MQIVLDSTLSITMHTYGRITIARRQQGKRPITETGGGTLALGSWDSGGTLLGKGRRPRI